MSRRFLTFTLCLGLTTLVLTGCTDSPTDTGATARTGKVTVYVANYPLKYFAERIGGEHVKVVFPAPGDQDPAFWQPDATTIKAYQDAELILLNGAGYARWTRTTSLPTSKLVQTSAGFVGQYLKVDKAVVHSHGPEGKHSHEGVAFTTWLDPRLAIQQAEAIRDALSKARPQHRASFTAGFAELKKDLEGLDQTLEQTVRDGSKTPIIFSHPVYQYLAKRYGLNGKSVHWEPDEAPTPKMWDDLKKLREKHPAKWMIWEGKPLEATVQQLEKLGMKSVVFDPRGNVPEKGDYLDVMRANVKALAEVYATTE